MAPLSRELRRTLENAVVAARGEAEAGARKAIEQLAVAHHEPWSTMTPEQQTLRRRLRLHGRQLGDRLEASGKQAVERLVAECAYEQWHRMLFARFLAECGFLIEPASGEALSVDECKELARERAVDWISLASAFAQRMLPQIFRADDPVLEIAMPAEHRQLLEQLLVSLTCEVFQADDSLGWVYQFWQSAEKKRINESEVEIGANELPAVTQLFTEDYMVECLLHNTLGAWWAGRRFPDGVNADTEEQARAAVALPGVKWEYLRFNQSEDGSWTPTGGLFSGWPSSAREITVLDPCMGSGHFLVFALPILAAMRMTEERVSANEACSSVLRDNLFGLEIDPRCAQISAFNVALAAWRLAGWQGLPPLNLACSGLGPNTSREDWMKLAGNDANGRRGMEQLFELFAQAPVAGSLIDPRRLGGTLLATGFQNLQPLLEKAVRQEQTDETVHELAVTAQGITKAAEILAGQFVLVITNVPYLKRGKQCKELQNYCSDLYTESKGNLACVFAERCLAFCSPGGSSALVIINELLFLGTYKKLRGRLLREQSWNAVARLGPGAFETIGGEVVNVSLVTQSRSLPSEASHFLCLDVAAEPTPTAKAQALKEVECSVVLQRSQLSNPDSRISCGDLSDSTLLSRFADFGKGSTTGDSPRFLHGFWEYATMPEGAVPWLDSPDNDQLWSGRRLILNTSLRSAALLEQNGCMLRGQSIWGRPGLAVNKMSGLQPFLYAGEVFDDNVGAIVPKDFEDVAAILTYCQSGEYLANIKKIDQAIKVTAATLVKVPFDRPRWRSVATEKYPHGLPKPDSDDPTQWLFSGTVAGSRRPLHVAVARLLGYRWPRQNGSSFTDCPALEVDGLEQFADEDGIVCISPLKGREPAADRLSGLLATVYTAEWQSQKLDELLAQVGYAGRSLDDWLRDAFFLEHCELFDHRPFLWHVWDGRRDGFSALVNYHKLTRANLEKLTYAYLGDWISRQQAAALAGEAGSDARLVAATQLRGELKSILEGDPPYDIFVRWKSLAKQPIGWEPDLNDGVRVNIRPFMMAIDLGKKGAGILRARPNIKWDKDRGKEPARSKDEFPWFWGCDGKDENFAGASSFDGNRWNDLHYSREFKMAARRLKGLA